MFILACVGLLAWGLFLVVTIGLFIVIALGYVVARISGKFKSAQRITLSIGVGLLAAGIVFLFIVIWRSALDVIN